MYSNETTPVEGFRLSPQQHNLWTKLNKLSAPFHAQASVLVKGDLDLALFRTAVAEVVQNHEILRTTFQESAGQKTAMQVISSAVNVLLYTYDFSKLTSGEQKNKINSLCQVMKQHHFDLANGPLILVAHIYVAQLERVLLLTVPALCADASGLSNLVAEIARCYSHRKNGTNSENTVMQYADIAEWQFDLLEGEDGKPGRDFWLKPGVTIPLNLQLPFEISITGETDFHFQELPFTISNELQIKIKALAKKNNVSLSTVLLASFLVLLWRLTGKESVGLGCGFNGRKYEELTGVIGLFAKYLPLEFTPHHKLSFNEFLNQVNKSVTQIDQWQDFFSWEQSNGTATATATATENYFPYCFDFEELSDISAGELQFSFQAQSVCFDRFKLRLACSQKGSDLQTTLLFNPEYFKAGDTIRFVAEFRTLMESACEHPQCALDRLNVLSAAERCYLLDEFNETRAHYPQDKCIHHLIEEQVTRTPDKVAVTYKGNELTYYELNKRANQLAHRLQKLGVGPDVLVAVSLQRSLDMFVAVLAILKAGGAYVPLDPAYPQERLDYMLAETAAPVVVTKQCYAKQFPAKIKNVLCLDSEQRSIAQESSKNPNAEVLPGNLVYVIYTSGSTGKPKGVVITHQDLVISNCARIAFFNESIDKFLLLSSLSFDSSVVGIFWTLTRGGTLFLVPEELQQNVHALTATIYENRISHLLTLPSFYSLILEYAKTSQLDSLKTVIVAGEACPIKMVNRHKTLLKNTALYSEYGATETTVFSSVFDCLTQELKIAPVGSPINNAQMYVLDSFLQPAPIGLPGEVYFGGAALAQGYLNRPELTAERFVPNPFAKEPGQRLYRSGDLARHLPNGEIEFLGRIDNQVKIRGYRIEMEEIEAVLGQHPDLREVAVIAVDAASGKRLVVYVACSGEKVPTVGELRKYMADRVPDYMVPAVFVVLDNLPKNPNGKIDRKALPDPDEVQPSPTAENVAPRTETEQRLAEIWASVLGLKNVGVFDNFFELGGDSILSIQIIARANQRGLAVTPAQIFQHQTIAELARVAGDEQKVQAEQGVVSGEVAFTPIQNWFFERELPQPGHFNMSLLFELRENVAESILQEAVQLLVPHHDALRLRFTRSDGWHQTIVETTGQIPIDKIDLSALNGKSRLIVLKEKTAEFQSSLDIGHGPVTRLVIFDLGSDQPKYLLWVVHHLLMDGVSWRILLEDFQNVVKQLVDENPVQLPLKTTSFKHWAQRLNEYAQTDTVCTELEYWLESVPGKIQSLPQDFQNSVEVNNEASVCKVSVQLSAEETRTLLHEAPKAYNTRINDILLAALTLALAKWTGRTSFLIDLEAHGREDIFTDVDLSRTVGWFTTFYPVLLSIKNEREPQQVLMSVKKQLRSIPNRGFNYGLLRYLNTNPEIAGKMKAMSRPEINFNYLGQFDQVLEKESILNFAEDVSESDFSPSTIRSHVLEIVGSVKNGQLQMEWFFCQKLHQRTTIEVLAKEFLHALCTLITDCQSTETRDFSASDFANFDWDESDFQDIAAAILKTRG